MDTDTIVHYTKLYDIYKNVLTEKQRDTFEDYYFENLTIEEIAENNGVSKNAISKSLMGIKSSLDDMESKLHFLSYMDKLKKEFSNDTDVLSRIEKYDNIIL